MMNSMMRSVYDSFDREAAEWYKTTYSVRSYKPNFLEYNQSTGEVKTKKDIQIDPAILKSIKANSGKSGKDDSDETRATASQGPIGNEETKLPSYVFKKVLKDE